MGGKITMFNFFVNRVSGSEEITVQISYMLNAGYAGRTQEKVLEHIEELEKLGVSGPTEIPILFPITFNQATQEQQIDVQGEQTSGEIEFVLLLHAGEWFVTVGSDHTDRELEQFSVEKSKQACPNVLASCLWPVTEVIEHWDQIHLRAWVTKDGTRVIYQDDTLAALLPYSVLLDFVRSKVAHNLDGIPIFSGTIATLKGLIFADFFEMEMLDPVLKRSIRHQYSIRPLTQLFATK
ncbi:MAG: DUF2848 domain-containing protein [Candidatus Atribacteria bacterium]|nr:MAG: DUF2848 domain-containing protein [Candidatus Atribacteria bacterium]